MGGAFSFRLLKPITIYNMGIIAAIAIAAIIGIVVLYLIARDISKEIQKMRNEE